MIATNDKYAQANSKSGHKNISYQRQRDAYVVNVMREKAIFSLHYANLSKKQSTFEI